MENEERKQWYEFMNPKNNVLVLSPHHFRSREVTARGAAVPSASPDPVINHPVIIRRRPSLVWGGARIRGGEWGMPLPPPRDSSWRGGGDEGVRDPLVAPSPREGVPPPSLSFLYKSRGWGMQNVRQPLAQCLPRSMQGVTTPHIARCLCVAVVSWVVSGGVVSGWSGDAWGNILTKWIHTHIHPPTHTHQHLTSHTSPHTQNTHPPAPTCTHTHTPPVGNPEDPSAQE